MMKRHAIENFIHSISLNLFWTIRCFKQLEESAKNVITVWFIWKIKTIKGGLLLGKTY